jgi:AraC-like DNA-binding protein
MKTALREGTWGNRRFYSRPPSADSAASLRAAVVTLWTLDRAPSERSPATPAVLRETSPMRLVVPDGTVSVFFALRGDQLIVHASPPQARTFEASSADLPTVLVAARLRCGVAHRAVAGALEALDPRRPVDDPAWTPLAGPLGKALQSAIDPEERLLLCEAALTARLVQRRRSTRCEDLGALAVSTLRRCGPAARMRSVARTVGVTERHLRRVVREAVGLSPKELTRVWRLRRALGEVTRGASWSYAACQAGYYDQAHMIAEFRTMTALSPTAFLRRWRYEAAAHSMPPARAGRNDR